MAGNVNHLSYIRGAVGGATGAVIGYFAFFLLARQGFYAMVLPGTLVGLGCGYLSGIKSNVLGILCGVLAVLVGLFTEWRFAPFVQDASLEFFIMHVHDLKSMTLITITIGGLFGFWFGRGSERRVLPRPSTSATAD